MRILHFQFICRHRIKQVFDASGYLQLSMDIVKSETDQSMIWFTATGKTVPIKDPKDGFSLTNR